MKCRFCGRKMSSSDPTYHNGFHYECNLKALKEIENLNVAKIVSVQGTLVKYEFNNAFFDLLNQHLDNARIHIIPDKTVDEDFVTLFAVIRAVDNYLPKSTPKTKVFLCCEMVFNTLMTQQYGVPLVPCKRFGYRVEEFAKEVYSSHVNEEMANELKQFKKINRIF